MSMSDIRAFLPPEIARLMQQLPGFPPQSSNSGIPTNSPPQGPGVAEFTNGFLTSLPQTVTRPNASADATAGQGPNSDIGDVAKSMLIGANQQAGAQLGKILVGK